MKPALPIKPKPERDRRGGKKTIKKEKENYSDQ